MLSNKMCIDDRIPSVNGPQLKEQGSSRDEITPKVRKPYTISKQRERWTEEEHKKFVEALQLHGRAWHRIEEHIGTKTAVQIRSHAQKFFSKVVRESAADCTGSVKPIEIPPPRPKRKPVHPYPRKMGNSSANGRLTLGHLQRSSSPILSTSEQENGSPTSVLSAVGSDALGSFLSNLPNNCASPVSSVAGSNEQETSVEEENGPSPGQATAEQSAMESDLVTEGHALSKEASSQPCLKLFGRTVMVMDSHKASSSSVGNTVQVPKSLPNTDVSSQTRIAKMDLGATAQPLLPVAVHGDLQIGPRNSSWGPWSGGVLPMFYSFPSAYGDAMNSTEARIIPLPLWVCGNLPFPSSQQVVNQPSADPCSAKELQKECSWTGSNTASASEGGNAGSSQSAEHCNDNEVAKDYPVSTPRASSDKALMGFVPYKRCVMEGEVQQPQRMSDEGEGLR